MVSGVFAWGWRRVKTVWLILSLALLAGVGYCTLRPVCVPLSDEDLKNFTVPIEQRTDQDFYLRIFQYRDDRWCQCKTWISRQFFF